MSNKKTCRGLDIPAKAMLAIQKKLTPEQVDRVSVCVNSEGFSLQREAEKEIERHGGNRFHLSDEWWDHQKTEF